MSISVMLVVMSTVIIFTSIVYVSTRTNKTQFHYVYIMLILSMLVWSVGAIGEVTSKDVYDFNPFIQTCNYLGIGLVSVFVLLLGIVFTHTKIILTWKYALLLLLPIGSAISIATNESHHLFMRIFCIIIKYSIPGPLMMVHYVYCYSFIAIGMGYLVKHSVNNSGFFSKQAITLVAAILIPLIQNVFVSFGIIPGGCYSTIPALVIFIILIGVATLKLDMFNIVPIALQKVVDHITDGFIVLNENNMIIDFNIKAQQDFYNVSEIKRNLNIKEFMNSIKIDNFDTNKILHYIQMSFEKKDSMSFDTSFNPENKVRHLNIEVTPMFNKNTFIGTILLYRDTTKYIENLQMIKEYQLLLENNLEEVTRDKHELLIRSAVMEKLSKTDALTDMYNHRTFQEYFRTIIKQISMTHSTMQLAILDIDDFKKINDTFGHSIGDIILNRIANKIKTLVTIDDIPARYGGEEFAVILTNKTMDQSMLLLESIRKSIQDEQHIELNGNVTVSIGIHQYCKGDKEEDVFNKADEALYEAKLSGKNKIIASNLKIKYS